MAAVSNTFTRRRQRNLISQEQDICDILPPPGGKNKNEILCSRPPLCGTESVSVPDVLGVDHLAVKWRVIRPIAVVFPWIVRFLTRERVVWTGRTSRKIQYSKHFARLT